MNDNTTLDFQASSTEDCLFHFNTITHVLRENSDKKGKDTVSLMVLNRWMKADTNHDGKLDIKEIGNLCTMLNLNITQKILKDKFNQFDKDKSGTLEYEEFVQFYRELMDRAECLEIFSGNSSKGVMTKEHFKNFLTKTQNEPDLEDVHFRGQKTINFSDFTRFLFSVENSVYDPKARDLYQDMTKPLVEYYMNSSHNTYLSGNQLTGASSVDMYQRALVLGCRCVEIDCWDGKDGEPIVTHGNTLTSKIKFADVIKVIYEFAFVTTPYPVILSLEVHTSEPQQEKMAQIMKDVFGDTLFTDAIGDVWPSPDALKNKIILKNKKLKKDQTEVDEQMDEIDSEDEDDLAESEMNSMHDVNNESVHRGDSLKNKPSTKDLTQTKSFPKEVVALKKKKLSPKLSDITTLDSQKFKSWKENNESYQMVSFSEVKVKKLIKKAPNELEKYTKRQFIRVYPKGTRIQSTNLHPIEPWNNGCQIVAMNFQTLDQGMRINILRFFENGSSGYVLKPLTFNNNVSKTLTVNVISGEQIPRPGKTEKGDLVDPYVHVQLMGPGGESFKTKPVMDEGFHPVWNEKFTFKVQNLELSYLYFAIYDWNKVQTHELIGDFLIPLTHLRTGYRSVDLYDADLKLLEFAKLFCHLQLE
jgi:phosphatidylinositol phospholipase C delta